MESHSSLECMRKKAVAMKWDVLSVARGILDPDTGKYLGMIVIDCSVDNFAEIMGCF